MSIPTTDDALCVFEERFHPLQMIFNENEVWLPDEGEEIILTSPPVFEFKKPKVEEPIEEDEGIDGHEESEESNEDEDSEEA